MTDQSIESLLFDLTIAKTPSDVFNAWSNHADQTQYLKLIIALNNYHRHVYPNGLNDLLSTTNYDFVAYFQSDNLFFFDDQLLRDQCRQSKHQIIYNADFLFI